MKTSVIKELTSSEIQERLVEEQKQLVKLKLNHAVSPLENPMVLKGYKATIARLKTELKKREIEANTK